MIGLVRPSLRNAEEARGQRAQSLPRGPQRNGGLLLLREIEQRLKVADRLAACIDDPRDPDSIVHTLADIIRFRLLMIAAGYEDGNDAASLRVDPVFKIRGINRQDTT